MVAEKVIPKGLLLSLIRLWGNRKSTESEVSRYGFDFCSVTFCDLNQVHLWSSFSDSVNLEVMTQPHRVVVKIKSDGVWHIVGGQKCCA